MACERHTRTALLNVQPIDFDVAPILRPRITVSLLLNDIAAGAPFAKPAENVMFRGLTLNQFLDQRRLWKIS